MRGEKKCRFKLLKPIQSSGNQRRSDPVLRSQPLQGNAVTTGRDGGAIEAVQGSGAPHGGPESCSESNFTQCPRQRPDEFRQMGSDAASRSEITPADGETIVTVREDLMLWLESSGTYPDGQNHASRRLLGLSEPTLIS